MMGLSSGGWSLVVLSACLQAAATLLLRAGVGRAGGLGGTLGTLPQAALRLAGQPLFVAGALLYALAALVWFRVLASEPLSTAYPLLVSLTFLIVTAGAAGLFQESLNPRKLAGMAILLIGIGIVSSGYVGR